MKEQYVRRVGKELQRLREEHGLSVITLSFKANIPTSTIYRYENGMGIKLDKLADILKVYKMNLATFFVERVGAK